MFNSSLLRIEVDENLIQKWAKEELKKILEESGEGCWWDMKRLEAETCRKRDWLIENILLNPMYKEEMGVISNSREGGRWMFRAQLMKGFLDKNFHNLNSFQKAKTS